MSWGACLSAAGQKLQRALGHGVLSDYEQEGEDQVEGEHASNCGQS